MSRVTDKNPNNAVSILEKNERRGVKRYFMKKVISVAKPRLVGTEVYFVIWSGILL